MIQFNKDDRGLSLIELIISLLILSVIVLAVVTSLSFSLRTNKAATDLFYAERAAANILEEVEYRKYGSISSITASAAGHKWDTGSGIFRLHEAEGINGAYYTFSNDTEGMTEYYKEGTEQFLAKITFDKQDYADNANDYTFAAVNDFSATTSILINPENSGINFDDAAVTYFLQSYRDKKYEDWLGEWQEYDNWYLSVSDESDRRVDNGQPAIKITDRNDPYFTVEGHEFRNKPRAFSSTDPDLETFKSCIAKSFIITLNHRSVEAGMTVEEQSLAMTRLKSATCMVRYKFTDRIEANPSDCIEVLEHEREFVGFTETITCDDNHTISNSRSVYLLYRPIDEDFARDTITIVNNVRSNGRVGEDRNIMNVFLVVQNKSADSIIDVDEEISGTKKHLKVDLTSMVGENIIGRNNLRVCSQAHLEFIDGIKPYLSSNTDASGIVVTTDSEIDRVDRLLTSDVKGPERVYKATIEIYSAKDPEDRLTVLETTIVEQ